MFTSCSSSFRQQQQQLEGENAYVRMKNVREEEEERMKSRRRR